jgi:Tfp pilus assembly PilM family ATPase
MTRSMRFQLGQITSRAAKAFGEWWRFGKRRLSIDIGSRCTKVIEFTARDGRLEIIKAISFDTPPDAVANSAVRDAGAVGHALRRNLRTARIGTASATTCLSGPAAVLKRFKLPLADAGSLEAMIRTEVDALASFGSDALEVDYQVSEALAEGMLDVLVAAARKETIDGYVAALRAAELVPQAVSVDSLALANLIDAAYGADPSRTVAFVHVGAELCVLGIRSHGIWVFTGSIVAGTGRAVRSLETVAGPGAAPEEIVDAIDRALRFYWPESAGDRFDEIVLSGGGAHAPRLEALLTARLGRSVKPVQSLSRGEGRQADTHDASLFAVAAGLAVGSLEAS